MGRLAFFVYRLAIVFMAPLVLVRFWFKGVAQKEYRYKLAERFGQIPGNVRTRAIWIHAVSVGEVNAARPLVEYLLEAQSAPVVMSCVTPTGFAQIQRLFGNRVDHVYAPLDAGFIVRKTLKALDPRALIIVETELWPNLIYQCAVRQLPVAFVNLRISDSTIRTGRRLKWFCRFVLQDVKTFCVQSEADAARIAELGAPPTKIYLTGNLKFEVEAAEGIQDTAAALRSCWGGKQRPTVVLGSSHEGEEQVFLETVINLREMHPELLAIIAPRHPERFDAVYRVISGYGLSVIRQSDLHARETVDADVILVNSMGELMQFYAASDVAVVGGSFAEVGGHNILEPVSVGTPPIFGPDMSNFLEIARLITQSGGGVQVQNSAELQHQLSELLINTNLREQMIRNGFQFLESNRGSLRKTVDRLRPFLELP